MLTPFLMSNIMQSLQGPLPSNVNCTQDQIYGDYIFYIQEPKINQNENLQCSQEQSSNISGKQIHIQLSYPNKVTTEQGETGYFSLDYTKQMSIYLNNYKYIIQFSEDENSNVQCHQKQYDYGWRISQIPGKQDDIQCVISELQQLQKQSQYEYDIKYKYDSTYSGKQELPQNFSWQDQYGKNFVPTNIQQHNADCYSFATIQMAMSRKQIALNDSTLYDQDPLSAQYIVDCNYMTGNTNGGMVQSVIDFGQIYGFLRESQYEKYTGAQQQCKYTNIDKKDRLFVSNILSSLGSYEGSINTIQQIQNEIYLNGPVISLMTINDNYRGDDLYDGQDPTDEYTLQVKYPYYFDESHYVLIVGWYTNTTDNKIYWIVQDSKFEGDGMKYVAAGKNIYNIESYITTLNIVDYTGQDQTKESNLSTMDIGLISGLCIAIVIIIIIVILILLKVKKNRQYEKIQSQIDEQEQFV